MNPSPFEISQGVAQTIGRARGRYQDKSALDEILSQASASKDPAVLNDAIGQILSRVSPERQPAAIKIIENKMAGIREQQRNEQQFKSKNQLLDRQESFKREQIEADRDFKREQTVSDQDFKRGMANSSAGKKPSREETRAALKAGGYPDHFIDFPESVMANSMKRFDKKIEEEKEEAETHQRTQQSFNRLTSLISDVGFASGATQYLPFAFKTREARGEFQSLLGNLESRLLELVSKGRLTDIRFNYIINQLLPTPNDTQSRIKGKMRGVARQLGLDIGVLGKGMTKAQLKSEEKAQEKEYRDNVKSDTADETVSMIDPDGNLYDIPLNSVDDALEKGLKYE